MDVNEICRRGYFDRVVIDGYMMPMYNNKGIVIGNMNESLIDCLENNKTAYNQCMGKLRINVAGEALNKEAYADILRMQEHREKDLKLTGVKIGTTDRYNIGYADILILKNDNLFPDGVTNKGNTEDDMIKLAKGEDELRLMLKALDIQHKNLSSEEYEKYNIAILDKLYINKQFRQCKISTWIHKNMYDLIKVYGMVDVGAILLMPGDFSSEAKKSFGMTNQEYVEMLIKHYKSMGYKFIADNIMYRNLLKQGKQRLLKLNT